MRLFCLKLPQFPQYPFNLCLLCLEANIDKSEISSYIKIRISLEEQVSIQIICQQYLMITREGNSDVRNMANLTSHFASQVNQITHKRIQNYVFSFNDLLGQGNFSKVYKAQKDQSNEIVAIKIIELNSLKSKKLEQLLFSQIQILKKLNHQNVLKCHQVFTSNRNCYIITELCNEGDLQSKLRTKKFMKQQQAQTYIKAVFKGLIYLSQMGIVHRDLKVANIFIQNGQAKIADFGFAKATTTKFKDINIGSPIYMSPEGFIHNIYGPKTDIWAFGMLIYELLHGKTPFSHCKSENQLKYNMSIPIGWSQLKPDLSTELKEVILKCLEVDQGRRITARQLQNLAYFNPKASYKFISKEIQNLRPSIQQIKPKNSLPNHYKQPSQYETNNLTEMKTRIKTENDTFAKKTARQYSSHLTSQKKDDSKPTLKHSKDQFLQINSYLNSQRAAKNRHTTSSSNLINSFKTIEKEGSSKYLMKANEIKENKEDVILSTQITFKECVNILHYCRLLFKHLVLMRDLNFGDENQNNIFKRWLSIILKTLMKAINEKKIKYEGDNLAARQKKLQQVTSQYIKKYSKQIGLDLSKVRLEQSAVINHQKILNYFNSVYQLIDQLLNKEQSNQGYLKLGMSMIMLLEGSKILKRCYQDKNYSKISAFKEIQEFLSISNQQLYFVSYQNYKMKYIMS